MHTNDFKRALCLTLLAILLIAAVVLGVRVAGLVQTAQREWGATPTPAPVAGNVMAVTPDPSLPTAEPVLRNGSQGETVKELQARLKQLGFYSGEVDGQFGAGTRSAVVLFQQQHYLEADGVVGAQTRKLLFSDAARAVRLTPTPVPIEESSSAPWIRPDGLPILVNRQHPLSESYPYADLVNMAESVPGSIMTIKYSDTLAEREAVQALTTMLIAAHQDGLTVWQISAAYRTRDAQQELFDQQVRDYMNNNDLSYADAVSATRLTVAEPGTSEHHLGLAFDVTVPGKFFKDTQQSVWLAEHCWDYGFILRYPEDKQDVTGFLYEPWHIRYVGVEHARIMQRENLCLEEYIQRYGR